MTPKTASWINVIASCAAIGLVAYQTAVSTGANTKSASITGGIAFLGALQAHFRESPADAPATPPQAPAAVVAAAPPKA